MLREEKIQIDLSLSLSLFLTKFKILVSKNKSGLFLNITKTGNDGETFTVDFHNSNS